MSAAGTARSDFLAYSEGAIRVIGAHADYSRRDFIFPRAQSLSIRTLPWETRLRPMKSWSELIAYGATVIAGIILFGTFI